MQTQRSGVRQNAQVRAKGMETFQGEDMRKTIHRVAKIRRQRLVQVIEAAAVLAALAPASALAQSWNTGSGNWSVAGNWNPMSVPADGGSAYIVNNDSVNRTVTYDVDGSAITLNQFEIDQTGSGSDTLVDNFSDNNLTANYETIGDNGQGALVSYDLTNSVNNYLWVGLGAGSSGTYTMNSIYNAVLTMGASGVETIGQYGTGTFNNIGNINFPTFSNYYGSTLYLGYGAVTGSGTYNLDGGLLTGDGNAYVGYSGRGIFNQTNDGSNTVGGELDIAANPGSTGSYTMGNYGGTLTVNGTGLYVGGTSTAAGGNGTLTVGVGSSATVAGTLQVYPGASNSVSLNGGTITAAALTLGSFSQLHWNSGTIHLTNEALYIDSTSNANFSGSSLTLQAGQNLSVDVGESVGDTGTGTITQNGGSNTMNGSSNSLLIIGGGAGSSGATSGTGTYNLSGGSLFVNGGEYLGYDGSGSIVQTGGNNSISGELVMGVLGSSTYSLSGGSLTAGAEIIGYLGTGAIFTQTSGTNTISSGGSGTLAGELSIGLLGGSVGTYTLSGGTLNVEGSVYVGGSDPADYGAGGIGTLNVNENSGASELTITGTLKVYPGSTVNLSYSKIQTGALDLSGIYSALNWSVGTLELTNTNVVLDSTVVGPTDPLGSNMTIASGQTFIVDLDETIGGVGGGSLTVNGTHVVGETLTLTSNGTLTVNSGGSLSFESFLQEGGVVNGTITNTGSFTYQSGVFNARRVNQAIILLPATVSKTIPTCT
jgi:fibronectin-binding autotransporter adhesin